MNEPTHVMRRHAICLDCWTNDNPQGAEPIKRKLPHARPCCFCGKSNTDGIDVHGAQAYGWCKGWKGIHEDEDDEEAGGDD